MGAIVRNHSTIKCKTEIKLIIYKEYGNKYRNPIPNTVPLGGNTEGFSVYEMALYFGCGYGIGGSVLGARYWGTVSGGINYSPHTFPKTQHI